MAYLSLGDLWLCLSVGPVTPRRDYTHLALACTEAEFGALSARLEAASEVWQENRSDAPSLYVLDPDGHRVELHAGTLERRLAHYRAHPDKGVAVAED